MHYIVQHISANIANFISLVENTCTQHFNTCKVISVECYLLFPWVLSQSHSNDPCRPCFLPNRLDLYITHNQTSVYSGSRAEDQCSSHQRSYCPYVLWMVDTTEKRRVAYHHDISLYMCMMLTSFFQSHMNVDIQFFFKMTTFVLVPVLSLILRPFSTI